MNSCLIVLCAFLACTFGAPQRPEEIPIISQTNNISPEGNYDWSYETGNKISAQETGTLKRTNDPENPEVIVAQGGFAYTDKDGNQFSIQYVADDEGGFQPQGAHLPTPPPIPATIQRALDFIASQERGRRRK